MVNLKKFNKYIFLNFIGIENNLSVNKIISILNIIKPKKGKEKRIHF